MIFATDPSYAMCVLVTIYPNKSQKQKTKKEKTNTKWANWFIYWPKPYFLSLEESLSITTGRCELAIATHARKMHKNLFVVVHPEVLDND
jgi:hypothetical protein